MTDRLSFRADVERLEEIVRQLEGDDFDLDEAMELFEEGVKKLKSARELLKQSELKIKHLMEAADGTLDTEDMDI